MEKIDQILDSLYNRVIEPIEAKEQLLLLFGISHRNLDKLKIEWLINDTYKVVDERGNVMKQGSIDDCNNYLTDYYGG